MESKITPQFYVEWLKKNINEIAEKCGWAEITAIQKEPLELHNEENAVICFSTLHKDGIKTYYLCEICDEEMPFSAVMESFRRWLPPFIAMVRRDCKPWIRTIIQTSTS